MRPLDRRAFIVECDMVTAYGWGVEACWEGIRAGRTALRPCPRLKRTEFKDFPMGHVEDIEDPARCDSHVMRMIGGLWERRSGAAFPSESRLLLATAKGEIDLLERALRGEGGAASECTLEGFLARVRSLLGLSGRGAIVSSACASSAAALGVAAAMIRDGEAECVLVVAADAVTEFAASGFHSLMALDPAGARPFDSARAGLSAGEGAAYAFLMSAACARRMGRASLGEVKGFGLCADANHMTGPARDGNGLARAIEAALLAAGATTDDIGSVSAHGTGTPYNDSMELKALSRVFGGRKVPAYSAKGGLGHTMGAAGLIEALLALRSMDAGETPPTVNLSAIDPEARGWVSMEPVRFDPAKAVLSTNSGFGGVNAALVLERPEMGPERR